MKRIREFLTYRQKIAYSFSALIILPVILFAYFMISFNISQSEKQFSEQSLKISSVYTESVADLFTLCMQKLNIVENDYTLQKYLSSENNTLSDLVEMRYYLFGLHNSMILGSKNLDITIYRFKDNEFPDGFVKTADKLDESIIKKCLEQHFGEILMQYDEKGEAFHFYKLNKKLNQDLLSITEVKLPLDNQKRIFRAGGKEPDSIVVFLTADGIVLPLNSSELPEPEYGRYLNGQICKKFLIIESRLIKSNQNFSAGTRIISPFHSPKSAPERTDYGSIVLFFPSDPIYNGIWLIVLFLIAFAALILATIERMSKVMTRKLDVIVGQVRETYLPKSSEESVNGTRVGDEFAMISTKMMEMLDEINRKNEREKTYSLEKKELETQLLQELINPHFLYNTLDSIKWLSGDPKVSQIVDSIVDYYRMLLSKGHLFVSIDVELKIVEEYVKIQKFAYESNFHYALEMKEDISHYFMMKHTLQPFVENSILHGIDKSGSKGFINLRVRRDGMFAIFEVEDNGYGAEQSLMDNIMSSSGLEGQGGYGIFNVKRRLNNVYENQAVISIRTAPDQGTLVVLRLPLRENP